MRTLAGFGPLLRLALRRDRIKLPVWIVAIVGVSAYCAAAIRTVYSDLADLKAIVGFLTGPAGTVLSGPGYGLGDPTYGSAFAGVYGIWVMITAAFGAILLVVRHTRAEEEAGRLELVRAGRVGRSAPLAVAATLTLGLAVSVLVLTWGALTGLGYDSSGAALFAAGVAVVAVVFAAIAGVAAQMAETSRGATSLAAGAVAVAMVVRGAGDVLEPGGSWLSWLSPFAWSQQTRAFVDGRWWPLLLGVFLGAVLAAVAHRLAARRDLGAGLIAARPGHRHGSAALGTPFGLALRLERTALIGWSVALLLAGLAYGALTDSVASSLGDLDNELVLTVFGGDPSRLVDGYLGTCALSAALMGTGYAVAVVHRLVTEETSGRAELVLATAVPRPAWLAATALTAALAASIAVVAGGVGMGVGTLAVTGSPRDLGAGITAHLAYLPAIWLVVAVSTLAFAVRTRWLMVGWVLVAHAAVVGFFGAAFDLPGWVTESSPFGHVPLMPLEDPDLGVTIVLSALASALLVVAAARFRRRDLTG